MGDGPNVLQRQGLEFILLQKVVQVLLQHFKDQTSVVFVSETLISPHEIVLIRVLLGQSGQNTDL